MPDSPSRDFRPEILPLDPVTALPDNDETRVKYTNWPLRLRSIGIPHQRQVPPRYISNNPINGRGGHSILFGQQSHKLAAAVF